MDRVLINDLNHQGLGIARINGKVIFIPNCLKDEVVDIEVLKDKKNYMIGRLISIFKESKDRVKPICPYFGVCGGCDIMHMTYDKQLLFKKNKVENILSKYLSMNIKVESIGCDDLYYRNKVSFKVDQKIGFYKKKSNDIINIDKCFISLPVINDIVSIINGYSLNRGTITIRASFTTGDVMVILDKNNLFLKDVLKDKVSSIVLFDNYKYTNIYGSNYLIDSIDNIRYMISPSSFFQVNTLGASKLYDLIYRVSDLKGDEKVLDLYCGTGTISLYLSRFCRSVVGIEINEDSIRDANKNKALNNICNVKFICGDVLGNIEFDDYDLVIVDPPRSGLNKGVIDDLFKINSKKIVYVSCDPMSLVRDLGILKDRYRIISVNIVDMFAYTYHVESVVLLERIDES